MTAEAGTYYGRIVDIGTGHYSTGTPYIFVGWQVTHQAVGGEWKPVDLGARETKWSTSERALSYTIDRLARLGFNGDFDAPEFTADPNPKTEGVELVCTLESGDNGKVYEKWDISLGRERNVWDKQAKREFAALYKQQARANQKPSGAPPAPPTRQPAPVDTSPVRDDELPGGGVDVPEDSIPF
jgi:hypothetical protein